VRPLHGTIRTTINHPKPGCPFNIQILFFDSKLSHKCVENCTTASRCTIISELCIRNLKVRSTETLCPSSDLVFCPQDVNHLLGAFAWWWHYNGYSGNDINNECHLWWRCPSTKVYTFLQLTDWANIMCIILLYIYTTALLSPHCLVTPCKNCDIAFYHISWQQWSDVQVIPYSFVVLVHFITHWTACDTSLKCSSGSVCAPRLSFQRIILCLDLWDIFRSICVVLRWKASLTACLGLGHICSTARIRRPSALWIDRNVRRPQRNWGGLRMALRRLAIFYKP